MYLLGDLNSDKLPVDEPDRLNYLHNALVRAFGLCDTQNPAPEDLPGRIQTYLNSLLRSGPVLLLLDNWETVKGTATAHLIEALLETCRELRILATGRESLNIQNRERARNIERLEPEEARKLLETRIRERSMEEWSPTEQDKAAMEVLVILTDRIPLAIELAAMHSRAKNLAKIAAELSAEPLGRMTLLPKNVPAGMKTDRHDSLESNLSWSWKSLDPTTQRYYLV